MTRRPSTRRTVAAITSSIAAIGMLAACSSTPAPEESAAPSVAADDALHQLLPRAVQEAGSVRIGTEAYYPPYEYLAADGETVIGLDVDLLNAVTQRLGIDYSLDNVAFDTLLPSLDGGRYDLVVAAMSDTAERQTNYSFVDYFLAGQAIIVPSGNPENYSDLASLCGATVSVLRDSAQEGILTGLNSSECASKPIEVLPQASDTDALLQVQSERATAALTQEATGRYNAAQVGGGGVFEVANDEPIQPTPLGYVFAKDSALVPAFQAALQSLLEDGTYEQILGQHDLASSALDEITVNGGK